MKALHSIQNFIDQNHSPKPKRNLSDLTVKGILGKNLLGRFFEGLVGIDEVSKPVILQRAKEMAEDFAVLRVIIGLLEHSTRVL
jgi:hypothetical protein